MSFDLAGIAGEEVLLRFRLVAPGATKQERFELSISADQGASISRTVLADSEERLICMTVALPVGKHAEISVVSAKEILATVRDIEIMHEQRVLKLGHAWADIDFKPRWLQRDRRIEVTWLGSTFWAEMPEGFKLESLSASKMDVVNDLLFGNIGVQIFGRSRMLMAEDNRGDFGRLQEAPESRVLLAYSAGEDLTAALRILPPDRTIPYHSKRPMKSYFRASDGANIKLPSASYEQRAIAKTGNVVEIPTTFEAIGLTVGKPFGYRDNFGYAALGVLLSDFYGCNTVAFGSVMEQVFMKSGNNFLDLKKNLHARTPRYRDLLASVGLYFALPTGALSEVITNRICALSADRLISVPCPLTDDDGTPCGKCFKCFRKMRLDEKPVEPPTQAISDILRKRPLKSATSVVYAAQKVNYSGDELSEFMEEDLNFLNRYFEDGLTYLNPADIAAHIILELRQMGFAPMNNEDEERLRKIALVFDPENYSPKRSGITQ